MYVSLSGVLLIKLQIITLIYISMRIRRQKPSSSLNKQEESKFSSSSTRADVFQSSINNNLHNLVPSFGSPQIRNSYFDRQSYTNYGGRQLTEARSPQQPQKANYRPSFVSSPVEPGDRSVFTNSKLMPLANPEKLSLLLPINGQVTFNPSPSPALSQNPHFNNLSTSMDRNQYNLLPDLSKTTPNNPYHFGGYLSAGSPQNVSAPITPVSYDPYANFLSQQQIDIVAQLKILYGKSNPQQLIQPVSSILDDLGLKYNKNNIHQVIELGNIVCLILKYPSEEKAEIHRKANMLGVFDIEEMTNNQRMSMSARLENAQPPICECCNLVSQDQQLPLNTPLDSVKCIGISNHLYFLSIQSLRLLMWILLFVFSLFAVASNLKASSLYKEDLNGKDAVVALKSYAGIIATSIGSKQLFRNQFTTTTTSLQCWLGLVTILIWIGAFVYIHYSYLQKESQLDLDSITITDYTLLFKNLPRNIRKQDLQKQLTDYQNEMRRKYQNLFPDLMKVDIKIVKINRVAPFYLDDSVYDQPILKQVNKKYNFYKQIYAGLVVERKTSPTFSKSKDQMRQLYQEFIHARTNRAIQYKKFASMLIQKKKEQTDQKLFLDIFVTFENTESKQLLQRLHEKQSSFFSKLPCLSKRDYFVLRDQKKEQVQEIQVVIEPAVEPEDITWLSLSRSTLQKAVLNLISFIITAVLLCLSFLIILGLSGLKESQKNTKDFLSYVLSLVISAVIPGINFVISIILNLLTKLERNESYTHEQNSIGFKTVVASLINSILIPIAMAFYKANIFGIEGLADDIFFIALTNAFLPSILALVNPAYLVARLTYWWKTRDNKKLYLCQKELNILNQNVEFQVGTSYASIITLYLFTCFFVSLQPIIVIFAIIGLYLFYYACQFSLYRRCKRPIPGNNHINTRKFLFLVIGPLFYSLGSYFSTSWVGGNQFNSVPNHLAIALSIVCFVLPYREICKLLPNQFRNFRSGTYTADAKLFPCQYQNRNPLTSRIRKPGQLSAIDKYRHRLKQRQENLGGVSVTNNSDKLKIAQLFQDIDENTMGTSIDSMIQGGSQPSSQQKENRYAPIKISINQIPHSTLYNQQYDEVRNINELPQNHGDVVYLREGHVVRQPMAYQGERIYIIQSNQVHSR